MIHINTYIFIYSPSQVRFFSSPTEDPQMSHYMTFRTLQDFAPYVRTEMYMTATVQPL
jgi:hypothetical protein